MSKTHLVFTCAHNDPSIPRDRFDWLGKLIYDVKPDLVVDLGDFHDMKSLNSYDERYPKAVINQSYQMDIHTGVEALERLWARVKEGKKKQPYFVGFEGNHEHRIKKAINKDPRLEGDDYGISFKHLQTEYFYDEYNEYENEGPVLREYDGIWYGHYVSSGNYGKALSGKHHGNALLEKLNASVTVGHAHSFSYAVKQDARPNPIHGLVAGCFKGAEETWAGQSNNAWRKGVVIKRNVDQGNYDLQWISMEALRREYAI